MTFDSNGSDNSYAQAYVQPPSYGSPQPYTAPQQSYQGGAALQYSEPYPPVYSNAPTQNDMATVFHIVSLCCASLSFFFSPICVIVPVIMWFCVVGDLRQQTRQQHGTIHTLDVIVTFLLLAWFGFWTTIMTIFTAGLYAFAYIFLIPYGILIVQLLVCSPK